MYHTINSQIQDPLRHRSTALTNMYNINTSRTLVTPSACDVDDQIYTVKEVNAATYSCRGTRWPGGEMRTPSHWVTGSNLISE